ncbi:hypothetical protein D3O61_22340 [Vibrio vulnificus]|uniref:hypothetical protein n=1 Tax=Vibrio TaxID=662 RepID=UPI001D46DCC2|nr:hypothetical protein [Vibrio vulnificus]
MKYFVVKPSTAQKHKDQAEDAIANHEIVGYRSPLAKAKTCTHVIIIHSDNSASCAPVEEVKLHTPYHIDEQGKRNMERVNIIFGDVQKNYDLNKLEKFNIRGSNNVRIVGGK